MKIIIYRNHGHYSVTTLISLTTACNNNKFKLAETQITTYPGALLGGNVSNDKHYIHYYPNENVAELRNSEEQKLHVLVEPAAVK